MDDGSTDNTEAIVNQLSQYDHRVTYYKIEKNRGRGYARMLSIERATADVIVIWDIDDIYCERRLEEINAKINHSGYDFFYSNALIIDKKYFITGATNAPACLPFPSFIHPSLAFHKKVLRTCGYSSSARVGEDFELMVELVNHYKGWHSSSYHMLYLSDREVGPVKSFRSNATQIVSTLRLMKARKISLIPSLTYVLKRFVQSLVICLIFVFPPVHRLTLRLRNYGLVDGSKLSPEILNALRIAKSRSCEL